jgi:hypothetical protein
MEICPVKAALIHSDRQMDITKVIGAFDTTVYSYKRDFTFCMA